MNDYKEYEYEVEHDIFDLIILYKYQLFFIIIDYKLYIYI